MLRAYDFMVAKFSFLRRRRHDPNEAEKKNLPLKCKQLYYIIEKKNNNKWLEFRIKDGRKNMGV